MQFDREITRPRPRRYGEMMRLGLLLLLIVAGCQRPPELTPVAADWEPLHNVYRIGPRLASGSGPEDEAAFRTLRDNGITTILSVDGAKPNVELARKYGLKYLHIPIGYDGISADEAAKIIKVVQDQTGPIYLHCHHGKHRGPAAMAVVLVNCHGWTDEQAKHWMHKAGTDPKYAGLYEIPRPTQADLERAPNRIPETAEVPDLSRMMVEIDQRWDHLKLIRESNWQTPKDHPDLVPDREAVNLVELYREAGRLSTSSARGDAFLTHLKDAEQVAGELFQSLKSKTDPEPAFQRSARACSSCHAVYRDLPKR